MNDDAPIRIYVIAGEPSGDLHAAPLMKAIGELAPRPVVFRGIGGDKMKAAGLDEILHCDSISVIGLWEVLKRVRFFARLMRDVKADIADWKPDMLLTVDYPGFNMRIAEWAKAQGVRTVHYICPQVWVWHRNRIWKIARIFDKLLTIFPFEPECFSPTTLRPVFTGHPLVDRARETLSLPKADLPWLASSRRIALLPGSRPGEILKILPDMVAAAAVLEAKLETPCSFIVPASSERIKRIINAVIDAAPRTPQHITIVDGNAREVLRQAEAAAVTSGTATLEASLMKCPTALVYRTAPLTYMLGRIVLRKAGAIGLANLITGHKVMPELIQRDLTPQKLADVLFAYLTDDAVREKAIAGLEEANAVLGTGNAAENAAREIVRDFK